MESKTNYTAVGLIVLILLGALIASALWLSVGFDKKVYNTYQVYVREAVSGLNEESPVKYNGVKVGYVKKIKLNRDDPRQVEILLSIEAGTPITTSTYATLISQGITGNSYVGLSATTNTLKPLEVVPGERYPVIPAKPSIFNQLDKVLQDVSTNVNKVSSKLEKVLDDKNIQNFEKILHNIEIFSKVVADNSLSIDKSIQNADVFLKNMKVVSTELKGSLQDMTDSVTTAGEELSASMHAGKNTFNQVSQDFLPAAALLIQRLNNIAINLEELSALMRQNPSVVLRGTTPREKGPGE